VFQAVAVAVAFLGLLVTIAFLISSIIIGIGAIPEVIRDIRANRWVGLGWALVVASSFGAWPAWYDLQSVPLTAIAALALVAGAVLVFWLPERMARNEPDEPR
jgi:hypothetical protein